MAEKEAVTLPPLHHVGIVVKGIEKASEYYMSTFGIGPFPIREAHMEGVLLRGRPVSPRIKVGSAQSGDVQIELIQPVEGESVYAEFLSTHGEGLHHLGFIVSDFDAEMAKLTALGIKPIFTRKSARNSFAYLDTDKVGGVIFEILQLHQ